MMHEQHNMHNAVSTYLSLFRTESKQKFDEKNCIKITEKT